MSDAKQNRFLPYLREDRLPHIFCPGCEMELLSMHF